MVDVNNERLRFAAEELKVSTHKFDAAISVEKNAEALVAEKGLREGPDVVIEATGVASCVQLGIELI